MQYQVRIKKKVNRGLNKLPKNIRKLFFLLVEDLKADGPIQKSWRNFSPLGENKYHCYSFSHIKFHNRDLLIH